LNAHLSLLQVEFYRVWSAVVFLCTCGMGESPADWSFGDGYIWAGCCFVHLLRQQHRLQVSQIHITRIHMKSVSYVSGTRFAESSLSLCARASLSFSLTHPHTTHTHSHARASCLLISSRSSSLPRSPSRSRTNTHPHTLTRMRFIIISLPL